MGFLKQGVIMDIKPLSFDHVVETVRLHNPVNLQVHRPNQVWLALWSNDRKTVKTCLYGDWKDESAYTQAVEFVRVRIHRPRRQFTAWVIIRVSDGVVLGQSYHAGKREVQA